MTRTARGIVEAIAISIGLTGLLVTATYLSGEAINWLEVASVGFSFGSTWLSTRQVRFNYVFGVVSTSLLSMVFYQAQLYGSMALNLYLIPTVIYGYFVWGKDTNTRPVERVKPRNFILYAAVTALTWLGAYLLIGYFGGQMGGLDGWMLVGSVLAQFLLDRKKIETWVVWMLVNIVSVYVYASAGLYLLAAQYALFLANAVYAYFQWRKTMVAADAENPAPLAVAGAAA